MPTRCSPISRIFSGTVTEPVPLRVPIARTPADPSADAAALVARVQQVSRGAARAAVLGVNDGLVTNVCLILAVAGAEASAAAVRLAGFASLLAGALSMAAGEWVSVRSQVELFNGLLDELRRLVARNPALVLDHLATSLEDAGFGRATARQASAELPLDEERFLSFTARAVFGLNPDELGSPRTAALSSLALFAVGAALPLLPWLVMAGTAATIASLVLTAVASVIVGAIVSRSSGRSVAAGGFRQLAIVVVAAATTYGIGKAFGTVIA